MNTDEIVRMIRDALESIFGVFLLFFWVALGAGVIIGVGYVALLLLRGMAGG
jgi:hypothetical protein